MNPHPLVAINQSCDQLVGNTVLYYVYCMLLNFATSLIFGMLSVLHSAIQNPFIFSFSPLLIFFRMSITVVPSIKMKNLSSEGGGEGGGGNVPGWSSPPRNAVL